MTRRKQTAVAPIRIWRKRRGLTQEQAARVLGIHEQTLCKIENWQMPVGKRLAAKIALQTQQSAAEVIEQYMWIERVRGRQ